MTDLSRFTSEEIRAELARRALSGRARRPQGWRESAELLVAPGERLEEELGRREENAEDAEGEEKSSPRKTGWGV